MDGWKTDVFKMPVSAFHAVYNKRKHIRLKKTKTEYNCAEFPPKSVSNYDNYINLSDKLFLWRST